MCRWPGWFTLVPPERSIYLAQLKLSCPGVFRPQSARLIFLFLATGADWIVPRVPLGSSIIFVAFVCGGQRCTPPGRR